MAACGNCGSRPICTCAFTNGCIEDQVLALAVGLPSGINPNYVDTPDTPENSVTGDLTIITRAALDDWTPSTDQTLVSKWEESGNQRAYRFYVDTGGLFTFEWSTDGTAVSSAVGYVAPYVNGIDHWLRVDLDVSTGDVRFWDSTNGNDWTFQTLDAGAGVTSIFDSTANVELGSHSVGTDQMFGRMYYAEIRDGILGDIVARFDPSDTVVVPPMTPTTIGSDTGETWTVNGDDWFWVPQSNPAPECTTVTGNGSSWAPINYRPNNVPLPRPYGHIIRPVIPSEQQIPATSTAAVEFNFDLIEDTSFVFSGGMTDLTTFPTRLTAPADGYYIISGSLVADLGNIIVFVRRNGTERLSNHTLPVAGPISIMTIARLYTGDYLELMVNNTNGSPVTLDADNLAFTEYGSAITPPNFYVQWMRPI